MIALPSRRVGSTLADWIELELLFGEHEQVTTTEMRAICGDDFLIPEEWRIVGVAGAEGASELDVDPTDIELEIEQSLISLEGRARRSGAAYPIQLSGHEATVKGDWKAYAPYAFMALLNARLLLGLGAVIEFHEAAILFERLVEVALRQYLGGETARFGWPPRGEFTGSFQERAEELARRMREPVRRPVPVGDAFSNDAGLDVAAWKSVDDRPSKVVILCQCGIGADYAEKTLPVKRWRKIVDFVCDPVTALAVPVEEFAAETGWRRLAVDAGFLLDRTRIARLAPSGRVGEELLEGLRDWVRDAVMRLPLS